VEISLEFPYNFERALDRLALDPLHAIDLSERSIIVPMEEGNLVQVKAVGSTEKPLFQVEGALDGQLQNIRELFHFHLSLDPVQEHFKESGLASLFAEHQGTPLIREFSLYGSLMKSIIHQQLNLAFAHTLTSRFVQSFGTEKEGVWFYPVPATIAALQVSDLRELQFSTRKAEYVIGLSRAIESGELDLHSMRSKSDEEITEELVSYRGVGPWTAQNFLLFGLGRPNLFPIADIGLQNALKVHWQLKEKPKQEEILKFLPEWDPYLSYAALYLWRSVE
jgi:DNA-3-methyladenine glycosylase II